MGYYQYSGKVGKVLKPQVQGGFSNAVHHLKNGLHWLAETCTSHDEEMYIIADWDVHDLIDSRT